MFFHVVHGDGDPAPPVRLPALRPLPVRLPHDLHARPGHHREQGAHHEDQEPEGRDEGGQLQGNIT